MGFNIEKSFVMAERLKKLREEKGLSHERLSKALFDQYGVKISPDSLINYEVADANHSKAYKNQGMRVEYLRYLADYYGVSADYLIGSSDIQSQDASIQTISKATGLSEKNAATLCYSRQISKAWNNHQGDANFRYSVESLGQKLGVPGFDEGTYNDEYNDYYAFWADCIIRFANDILDAYSSNSHLMDFYAGMLNHVDTPIDFDAIDPDCLRKLRGLVILTPSGYARYMAGEVSKEIDAFLVKKYGSGDSNSEGA